MNENFLWGGSIAAHQVEGACNQGSKGLGIMDLVTDGSAGQDREITNTIEEGKTYPTMTGIDFYHRYEEDISLFSEMGFTALRLSFDWTRIFPTGEEEEPNTEGLKFYHNVIDSLIAHNIEPIVTLCHFEMPMNLVKKYGSWTNKKVVEFFLKYCKTVFHEFKGKVRRWVTFNELNHVDPRNEISDIFTYIIAGLKYSEMENKQQQLALIGYHMILATAKAVEAAHRIDDQNQVGCVFGIQPIYPYNCKPENVLNAFLDMDRDFYQLDAMSNGKYPEYKLRELNEMGIDLQITEEEKMIMKNGTIDFIGLNYYFSSVSAHEESDNSDLSLFGGVSNPFLKKSEWGWIVDPVGFRYIMNYVYRRYGLPILVTENGLGALDELTDNNEIHDDYRIEYLKQHIGQLKLAIEDDHVDCLGYLSWGPIDLVSATTGEMKKRYGYIYVNKNDVGTGDYSRYKKDSFFWYRELIKSNGSNL